MIMTSKRIRILLSGDGFLAIANVNYVFFNLEEIPKVLAPLVFLLG